MNDVERVTRLVRVAPSRRDPGVVAVALVVLVAVALVKPWGSPAPVAMIPGPTPAAAPTIPARPEPAVVVAPRSSPVTGVERLCYQPTSWWLAAVVRWPGQTVQTREALAAVAASGPLDPAIPFETIHSSRVQAIGYCAPASGTERPPADATVAVWRIDSRAAVQIQPPTMPTMDRSILGRLWSPPSGPVATLRPIDPRQAAIVSWPTGRYVITLQGDGGAYGRWLGVEVILEGAA